MAHLYSNENSPLPVVEELRRLGHDVLTVQETGQAGQSVSDEEVLTFATEKGRAILTFVSVQPLSYYLGSSRLG
jgi:hypothetical protein